jgi:hypothetical protein
MDLWQQDIVRKSVNNEGPMVPKFFQQKGGQWSPNSFSRKTLVRMGFSVKLLEAFQRAFQKTL